MSSQSQTRLLGDIISITSPDVGFDLRKTGHRVTLPAGTTTVRCHPRNRCDRSEVVTADTPSALARKLKARGYRALAFERQNGGAA